MDKCCPICNSSENAAIFIHRKWKIPVLQCGSCTHAYSSQFIEEEDDSFETNRKRALYYLDSLSLMRPHSMMDIGTPTDFFFLKEAHNRFPNTKKYALDLYEKEHPDYVELLNCFSDVRVDICTAFHVLEHVEEPHQFIKSIINVSDNFIIEVPNCDKLQTMIPSSCNPHMHFFNIKSFKKLFGESDNEIKFMIRTGKDMIWKRSALVAYRLPNECQLENQKQTAADLFRTLRLYIHFAMRRLGHDSH